MTANGDVQSREEATVYVKELDLLVTVMLLEETFGKSNGHSVKTTRMRRTSNRRSIRLHPGQNGRCTDVTENSKVRMSRYLDASTKTHLSKIMAQYGRPSWSSWKKSVRSSCGRTFKLIRQVDKVLSKIRLGKSSKLGMLIRKPRKGLKGLFLSVYVDFF